MAKDYIPAKLADYRLFSNHFVELVSQKTAAWGIPDTAKTKLTGGHTAWTAAQAEADNPDTRTSLAMEMARRLRGEDTANIRWAVNTYITPNASGAITVEDRLDLGLHIKDTTPTHHPAPTSRPDTDVEPSGKYQHTVIALDSATSKKEKPADAYGCATPGNWAGLPPQVRQTCRSQNSAERHLKNSVGTPATKARAFITQLVTKIPRETKGRGVRLSVRLCREENVNESQSRRNNENDDFETFDHNKF
jgi:hypothetical protein